MNLIGDIGGTKVHLALVEKNRFVKEEIFPSRHYRNLSEIIGQFLDGKVEKACLAVAGPIANRKCHLTNLPWEIDADELEKHHGISRVDLLNDLEAASWGLGQLKSQDLVTLNEGQKQPGNQAVMAIGTGLGMSALYWDSKTHHPFASEGGHVDFAPRTLQDKQLWDYLHKKYGHVSTERIVSGPGLEHLYWFMVEKTNSKDIFEGEEIPKLILESQSNLCREVVSWFAELCGAAAGNVALQFLAKEGVYLAGGIPPKMVKILQQGFFMRAFLDKGRFHDLLSKIPIHIVLNEKLSLLGAAEYCKKN